MTETERLDWLKGRQKGMGGSDVASALGLNPYKTPLDLYLAKTEEVTADEGNEATHFGHLLEPVIAGEFARRMGVQVQEMPQLEAVGEPWRVANIDRAIVNPSIAETVEVIEGAKPGEPLITTDAILEIKTARSFMSHLWGASQEEEIKAGFVESEHKIPLYYETQCQWYLGVTGAKVCYLAVLLDTSDFRIYEIKRDDALIDVLVQKCKAFWFEHVVARVPPEPVNPDDVKKLYARDNGELIEASMEAAVAIGEIRNLNEQIKDLEAQRKLQQDRLIVAIGDKLGLTIDGEKVATYKAQQRQRLDAKALKEAEPDVYAQYVKQTTTRVLRVN